MKRTDEELIGVLESMGVPWGRHFVLNDALVCYYDESGRLFAHVIEDDELARLVRKFLVKNGKVMKEEER